MTVPLIEGKIRILCLHGYLQNAEIFRSKIGSLRKALKSRVEFVFVDAPFTALHATKEDALLSGGSVDGKSWWHWTDLDPGTRPSLAASYTGWDTSQNIIHQAIEDNWPVHALLGFSQGATAAALYLAHAKTTRTEHHVPKCAIFVGGFMPRDASYAAVITTAAALPCRLDTISLHISGKNDTLVPTERSEQLWGCFEESTRTVYMHEGAHMVPTCSGAFKAAMVDFLDVKCDVLRKK